MRDTYMHFYISVFFVLFLLQLLSLFFSHLHTQGSFVGIPGGCSSDGQRLSLFEIMQLSEFVRIRWWEIARTAFLMSNISPDCFTQHFSREPGF